MVEREIIYIRSRFSPLLDPQKFSNLSIQTLSPSSIAQVERTRRSGETRGFRIIQEARSMNERLRKSIIFTKRHLSSPVFTYRGGQEKGTGGGKGADIARQIVAIVTRRANYRRIVIIEVIRRRFQNFNQTASHCLLDSTVAFRALKVSRIVSFCQHY